MISPTVCVALTWQDIAACFRLNPQLDITSARQQQDPLIVFKTINELGMDNIEIH